MNHKCENCGESCPEQYKYCKKCNQEFVKNNAIMERNNLLRGINQNLGHLVALLAEMHPDAEMSLQEKWKQKNNKDEDPKL